MQVETGSRCIWFLSICRPSGSSCLPPARLHYRFSFSPGYVRAASINNQSPLLLFIPPSDPACGRPGLVRKSALFPDPRDYGRS